MNVEETLTQLYKENWFMTTINNLAKGKYIEAEDLTQEIALRCLTSTTTYNTIERINSIDEVKYYLTRAISLDIYSETSFYNQKYTKYNKKKDENYIEPELIQKKFYITDYEE